MPLLPLPPDIVYYVPALVSEMQVWVESHEVLEDDFLPLSSLNPVRVSMVAGAGYLVHATDTLGYSIVRARVAPIRCCASTPKSRSVKCPQCLKNSLFSVCCLSLNFLSSLNILSVSGSISSPSVCLFRKVFQTSTARLGE